MQKETMQNMRF